MGVQVQERKLGVVKEACTRVSLREIDISLSRRSIKCHSLLLLMTRST